MSLIFFWDCTIRTTLYIAYLHSFIPTVVPEITTITSTTSNDIIRIETKDAKTKKDLKLVYFEEEEEEFKIKKYFFESGNDELFYSIKEKNVVKYAVAEDQNGVLICVTATLISDPPLGMFYIISYTNRNVLIIQHFLTRWRSASIMSLCTNWTDVYRHRIIYQHKMSQTCHAVVFQCYYIWV